MPIYEYQCDSCGKRLEILQQISDAPLAECPACYKKTLKKLVSATGFRLSGGGWYETDFKKTKQRNLVGRQEAKPDRAKKNSTDKKTSSKTNKPKTDSQIAG